MNNDKDNDNDHQSAMLFVAVYGPHLQPRGQLKGAALNKLFKAAGEPQGLPFGAVRIVRHGLFAHAESGRFTVARALAAGAAEALVELHLVEACVLQFLDEFSEEANSSLPLCRRRMDVRSRDDDPEVPSHRSVMVYYDPVASRMIEARTEAQRAAGDWGEGWRPVLSGFWADFYPPHVRDARR